MQDVFVSVLFGLKYELNDSVHFEPKGDIEAGMKSLLHRTIPLS